MKVITYTNVSAAAAVVAVTVSFLLMGCGEQSGSSGGLEPKVVADMLHAVMAADRKVYVKNVVDRLTQEQNVHVVDPETKEPKKLSGSEQWEKTFGTLPLPAQQFRYGSEEAFKTNSNFSYGLISSWAINKNNLPKTDLEKKLIQAMEETGAAQYGSEEIGEEKFFVAMYPDRATAKACWNCHNNHKDSPRTDFEADDVMGGVVIRLPQ